MKGFKYFYDFRIRLDLQSFLFFFFSFFLFFTIRALLKNIFLVNNFRKSISFNSNFYLPSKIFYLPSKNFYSPSKNFHLPSKNLAIKEPTNSIFFYFKIFFYIRNIIFKNVPLKSRVVWDIIIILFFLRLFFFNYDKNLNLVFNFLWKFIHLIHFLFYAMKITKRVKTVLNF